MPILPAEVTELQYRCVRVHQQVLGLDVPMTHALGMDVSETAEQLVHVYLVRGEERGVFTLRYGGKHKTGQQAEAVMLYTKGLSHPLKQTQQIKDKLKEYTFTGTHNCPPEYITAYDMMSSSKWI